MELQSSDSGDRTRREPQPSIRLARIEIANAARAVTTFESNEQTLYREAQLALRAIVGARELDALL